MTSENDGAIMEAYNKGNSPKEQKMVELTKMERQALDAITKDDFYEDGLNSAMTMNEVKFRLKDGECWFVYDVQYGDDMYIDRVIKRRNGRVWITSI